MIEERPARRDDTEARTRLRPVSASLPDVRSRLLLVRALQLPRMTHAELVDRAVCWLRNRKRCGVVLREHVGGRDIPDAIGWRGSFSYVIECKISRADFLADFRKPTRQRYSFRPGFQCYYLTPKNLLYTAPHGDADLFHELPIGWGLLEARDRAIDISVRPRPVDEIDDRDNDQLRDEIYRLYCEVRRYQAQGIRYKTINEQHASR